MSKHWETLYSERKTILEKVLQVVKRGNKSYADKRFDNRFRHNALFFGPNTHDATANNTMLCLVTLTTPNGRAFTN
jgi:hypothetical protein